MTPSFLYSTVGGGQVTNKKNNRKNTTAKSFIFCHWTALLSSCLSFWILTFVSEQKWKKITADYSDPSFSPLSNLYWSCAPHILIRCVTKLV